MRTQQSRNNRLIGFLRDATVEVPASLSICGGMNLILVGAIFGSKTGGFLGSLVIGNE